LLGHEPPPAASQSVSKPPKPATLEEGAA
jgi:hypothetical protein